ncbi:MAG TPA: VWA domain-containing protein [Candidatus Acidoferrales bacterium]|nr:VWA domain-containing protein [Candidatus Acidoferrales bacterium]
MTAITGHRNIRPLFSLWAGLALAVSPVVVAQTSGPIAPRAGQAVQQPPRGTPQKPLDQSIRVRVNVVNTPVIVRDSKGELVLDLLENNFRIFDNGVQQRLEGFDMGGGPLSVVIVMETSSRIQPLFPALRRTGVLFTETVIGENGDGAVIGYDDQVNHLQDFTSDHDVIDKCVSNLQPGTSGARLYDALASAVGMLQKRPDSRRRVIVTVAEAVDSGSEEKLGQVLRDAQLANITIYSVGLSTTAAELRGPQKSGAPPSATPPGVFGQTPIPGTPQTPTVEDQRNGNVDLMALAAWIVQHAEATVKQRPLEVATAATGGLYQSTVKDSSIEKAIDEIGGELHAQYTLSYRPAGTNTLGYHEIRVQVVGANARNLTVRSRPGYYLSSPAQ